jgi:hypothetical protein
VYGELPTSINEAHPTLSIRIKYKRPHTDISVEAYINRRVGVINAGRPWPPAFIPCRKSLKNVVSSGIHRFGGFLPPQNAGVARTFKDFSFKYIEKYFTPPTQCKTREEWLADSNYSGARKRQLAALLETFSYSTHDQGRWEIEGFGKFETYDSQKVMRAIMASNDHVKLAFAHVFNAIDKATYEVMDHGIFVKGTKPADLPALLLRKFTGSVMETDFSSFECHHVGVFNDIVFHWMMHMTRGLKHTVGGRWVRALATTVRGVNHIRYGPTDMERDQGLMSGHMWTSSQNGVLNLLICTFLHVYDPTKTVDEMVEDARKHNIIVEGDDALCAAKDVPKKLIDELGIKLKFELHEHVGDASFCGMMLSTENLILTHPTKWLRRFFIVPPNVGRKHTSQMRYLRCKALSALHMYPSCPVISPIAKKICDLTSGFDLRGMETHFDSYHWDSITKAAEAMAQRTAPSITAQTRADVERRYGWTKDAQVNIEKEFTETGMADVTGYFTLSDEEAHVTQYHYHDSELPDHVPTPYLPRSVNEVIQSGLLERQLEGTVPQRLSRSYRKLLALPV